jgi:hypothetical protein
VIGASIKTELFQKSLTIQNFLTIRNFLTIQNFLESHDTFVMRQNIYLHIVYLYVCMRVYHLQNTYKIVYIKGKLSTCKIVYIYMYSTSKILYIYVYIFSVTDAPT